MADSIQSSVFYGSWSSRYCNSLSIFHPLKIEFNSDPTLVKFVLEYSDHDISRGKFIIDFNFKLSRNDTFCYGESIDNDDGQRNFIKIDLTQQETFDCQFMSIYPYDDGIIRMINRNLFDFIIKNVPDTSAEQPPEFDTHQRTGTIRFYEKMCLII